MSTHVPDVSAPQIARWIVVSARSCTGSTAGEPGASEHRHLSFDFTPVRKALNRARTKVDLKTFKPFRRIRTNQGAVNQSLIDALGGTVACTELLMAEIRELSAEVTELRRELARRDAVAERVKHGANGSGPFHNTNGAA
jgi:hypothetical protein